MKYEAEIRYEEVAYHANFIMVFRLETTLKIDQN